MSGGRSRPWLGAALALLPVAAVGVALLVWSWRADIAWFERHVLISYCAQSPGELRLISIARTSAAVIGALALLLFAPLVARWGSRNVPAHVASRLVWVLVALAASVPALELTLRWQEAGEKRALKARKASTMPQFKEDALGGWTFEPNQTKQVTVGGRTISYAINADGHRAPAVSDTPDLSRPTILIAGESVTFGFGLPFEETIDALLARETGLQVVNLSVVGYGTDQQYLRLIEQLPRFAHPVAVVVPFLFDQIGRNAKDDHVRLILREGGTLEAEPKSDSLRITRLWRDEPYHGVGPFETTRAILRATAAAARDRGAEPLFVVIDYGNCASDFVRSPPWIVDELFDRAKLPYVRVTIAPGEEISPEERHPGAAVSRRIVDEVRRALDLPKP